MATVLPLDYRRMERRMGFEPTSAVAISEIRCEDYGNTQLVEWSLICSGASANSATPAGTGGWIRTSISLEQGFSLSRILSLSLLAGRIRRGGAFSPSRSSW